MIQKSEFPWFPETSPLFEFVVPTTMKPPSEVCCISAGDSAEPPPNDFCHSKIPVDEIFTIQKSAPP